MLGWVIRLLLIALLIRVVISLVNALRAGVLGQGHTRVRERKSTSLARDPVCGTYIQPSHALSSSTRGTVHYFCSEDCRRTFHQRT